MHDRCPVGFRARKSLALFPVLALSLVLGACSAGPAAMSPAPTVLPPGSHPVPVDTPGPGDGGSAPPDATASGREVEPPARETPAQPEPGPGEAACPGIECVEVAVAGDILLHPALWEQAAKDGAGTMDFEPLLGGIAPFLAQADLSLCNLETPLAPPGGPYQGYPMFTVPQEILPALKSVGYDGCTTASNHTMDAGAKGVLRTLDALDAAGLLSTGSYRSAAEARKPFITPVGGAKVAVIAGTYSLNGMPEDAPWRVDDIDKASLLARAKAARAAGADIVMAAIHAGAEYTDRPTGEQKKLYRELAESGAFDFIYSHHTHSVLPIEKHANTWIVYGLGNSVAKHATKTVLNREGITVNMQFVRTSKGWEPGQLRWLPHLMTQSPVRWCALPAAAGETCADQASDAASLKRTTATVNAFGAKESGATRWALPNP